MPRWAVLAIGIPLVSSLDLRCLTPGVAGVLLWMLGLAGVSLIASPDPYGGAGEFFFIIILSLAFVAAAGLDDLDGVLGGVGWGLAVSSALCLLQVCGRHPSWAEQGYQAPAGLFYNSEVLAELASIVFVWAALRPRYLIALTAAVPVVLGQSRVALLAVGIGLFYALVKPFWARLLGLLALPGIGLVAVLWFGLDKLGSAIERLVIWIAMAEAITPLGHGLGWVYLALPREQFAHSDALQAVVELGFGAIVLIFIPFAAFRGNRGGIAERAAFLAGCAEILVSFPLRVPATGFVLAILASFLANSGGLVRMGVSDGGTASWGVVRRAPARAWRGLSLGKRLRRAVSVRSRPAQLARLCVGPDCFRCLAVRYALETGSTVPPLEMVCSGG